MSNMNSAPSYPQNVQPRDSIQTNQTCSTDYLKTIPGILKIIEMVSNRNLINAVFSNYV